jgi:hypothetical protein
MWRLALFLTPDKLPFRGLVAHKATKKAFFVGFQPNLDGFGDAAEAGGRDPFKHMDVWLPPTC